MSESRWVRIGASLASSLLLQARNLVISLVVFRLFTDPAELWGTVSQVAAVVTLLALPAKFGLEFTAVQFVAKFREDAPAASLQALAMATGLRLTLGVLVAAPLLLVPSWVAPWLGLSDVPHLVAIGGWLLLTTSFYEYAAFVLSGVDDFVGMAVARLVYAVVNIGAIAWIATAGWTDAAGPVLWAQVAGGGAAMAWCLLALVRHVRRLGSVVEPPPDDVPTGRALFGAIVRFSVPVTLVAAAGQVFSYLDRVMIPVLSDRAALGSYAVANSVIAAALFGTYAFRNVARSRLPGLLRRDPAAARTLLRACYRACLAVAVWIIAGTVTVAPDLLVAIYGPDATDAARMLVWFAPFVALSAHANASATALVAADRPRVYAWLMGGLSLVNFGLNLALIPSLGGYGAIAASTLSLVPLAVIAYHQVTQVYGDTLVSREVVREALWTGARLAAAGLCGALAGAWLTGPGLFEALAAGVAVTVVVGGVLYVTGDLVALREAA